jgi:hypothetical protein
LKGCFPNWIDDNIAGYERSKFPKEKPPKHLRQPSPYNSAIEIAVMRALASHAQDDGRSCFPSEATLADECGCSERTIRRVLKALADQKRRIIHIQRTGLGRPNRYTICAHGFFRPGKTPDTVSAPDRPTCPVKNGQNVRSGPAKMTAKSYQKESNQIIQSGEFLPAPSSVDVSALTRTRDGSRAAAVPNDHIASSPPDWNVERGDGEEEQEHRQADIPRFSDEDELERWRKEQYERAQRQRDEIPTHSVQSLLHRYDKLRAPQTNAPHQELTPEEEPFPQSPSSSHHTCAAEAPLNVRAVLQHKRRLMSREGLVRWLKERTSQELTAFVNNPDGADELMCDLLDIARSSLKRRESGAPANQPPSPSSAGHPVRKPKPRAHSRRERRRRR